MKRITMLSQSLAVIQHRYGSQATPDKIGTAVHEAAHAIVALACGFRVSEVWVERTTHGYAGGCRHHADVEIARERAKLRAAGVPESAVTAAAAGIVAVAEGMVTAAGAAAMEWLDGAVRAQSGQPWWDASGTDWESIRELAATVSSRTDPQTFWQESRSGARRLLDLHPYELDALAGALLWRGRLTEDQIAAIVGPLADRASEAEATHTSTRGDLIRPVPRRAPHRAGVRFGDAMPLTYRGGR
jgi:hypothetical protein